MNCPLEGQWRGALMFSLFRAWINGWVNNREAGDMRRHRAHYDVTVMIKQISFVKMADMRYRSIMLSTHAPKTFMGAHTHKLVYSITCCAHFRPTSWMPLELIPMAPRVWPYAPMTNHLMENPAVLPLTHPTPMALARTPDLMSMRR